jgi:hypothetical protein
VECVSSMEILYYNSHRRQIIFAKNWGRADFFEGPAQQNYAIRAHGSLQRREREANYMNCWYTIYVRRDAGASFVSKWDCRQAEGVCDGPRKFAQDDSAFPR